MTGSILLQLPPGDFLRFACCDRTPKCRGEKRILLHPPRPVLILDYLEFREGPWEGPERYDRTRTRKEDESSLEHLLLGQTYPCPSHPSGPHFRHRNPHSPENYGWNIMEGNHCYNALTCNSTGLVPPVAEYDHGQGCSITGGYIYRGSDYPAMQGIYFYADYCSGRLWGIQYDNGWQDQKLLDTGLSVSSFGQGENGEIYITDLASGAIYQLISPSR